MVETRTIHLEPPLKGDSNYGTVTGSVLGGSHNHNELTNVHTTNNYLGSPDDAFSESFKLLADQCAGHATHDSVVVSALAKCHPGTREVVLGRLVRWARATPGDVQGANAKRKRKNLIWMYGPAGTGKSAIERTLALRLKKMKLLLASFFFFRTDQGRNTSARFIATIAYQLALSIPPARPFIENAIQRDPNVFEKSLEAQAEALIVGPMSSLGEDVKHTQRIVIVDGLDECAESEQELVLNALLKITQETPFAITVASRPEPLIQAVFRQQAFCTVTFALSLDESLDPDADIRTYLTDVFRSIRENHPLKTYLPTPDWPQAGAVDHLISKASGQFIYASTVEKFVSSPKHKPHERLDIILGIQAVGSNRPYQTLDDLYWAIFNSIDKATLKSALGVMGVLLGPYEERIPYNMVNIDTRSPDFLESLLHLKPGDVRSWLSDLQSLLSLDEGYQPIRFYHASLADYLRNRSRSGVLYINPTSSHVNVLLHCGRHISPIKDSKDPEAVYPLTMSHVQCFLGFHKGNKRNSKLTSGTRPPVTAKASRRTPWSSKLSRAVRSLIPCSSQQSEQKAKKANKNAMAVVQEGRNRIQQDHEQAVEAWLGQCQELKVLKSELLPMPHRARRPKFPQVRADEEELEDEPYL